MGMARAKVLDEVRRRYLAGTTLTDEGVKLLTSVMAEVFCETGEWDFERASRLLQERYGLDLSPARVQQEWCVPGRRVVESAIEEMRSKLIAAMEERLRGEIVRAGLDLVRDREGLRKGGARAVRDLAEAASKLGGQTRKGASVPFQIVFQKIESDEPSQAIDVTPEEGE
jgi:hypothetical protein